MSRILLEHSVLIICIIVMCWLITVTVIVISWRTHRKKMENFAYTDQLTGLCTMMKFKRDVALLLEKATPGEYMLISADVNHFKYINDALGYQTGNDILRQLGENLCRYHTKSNTICRQYNDVFFMLFKTMPTSEITQMFHSISSFAKVDQKTIPENFAIRFSIGVYIIETINEDFYRMLDKANLARKINKGLHNTKLTIFTEQMNRELEDGRSITLTMENGIKNHEFQLYLQPKVSLFSQKLIAAEALVRWKHPERGLLSPSNFIPQFERNGFVLNLDLYMFESVCQYIAGLSKSQTWPKGFTISVNLSRYCIHAPNICETLAAIAAKYCVDPGLLEIELTESIVEYQTDKTIALIMQLKDAGFHVSIDDFGCGYSSLNLLTDLPVDIVKIDKGLLDKLYTSDKARSIIASTIKMISSLNMKTVAEGIETEEQAEYLRRLGCNYGQGYFFSTPIPCSDFTENFLLTNSI